MEGCSMPFGCFGEVSEGSRRFLGRFGAKLKFSEKDKNLRFELRRSDPGGNVRTFSAQLGILAMGSGPWRESPFPHCAGDC